MIKDLIIIGGGPSGLTSALYALRNNKTCLIIEKENFGGQISISPRVENFPSIKEISGMQLANNMYEQVEALGCEFELDECKQVSKTERGTFIVECTYECFEAKAVIISSGVKHRNLGVENETELIGRGISYCAVCDGAFYKGEDVALIGSANTALQYAIYLSSYCNKVYLVTRHQNFKGAKSLIKEVESKKNIIIHHNYQVKKFLFGDTLKGLTLVNTDDSSDQFDIAVKGCFIAIGYIPDNKRFSSLVDLEDGFILTNEKMETKTKGLFAAGDCCKKDIRQLTTACSDGTIASLSAIDYIDSLGI